MTKDAGMSPVRFAIVGYGNIGARHASILSCLAEASLSAVCDSDSKARSRVEETHPDVPVFDDLGTLLASQDFEVLNVCTPHYLHAPMSIQALQSGRHTLVEKPLALRSRDAEEMILAAERTGNLLMVVKQNRYNVPVALARRAIDEGRLGRILMAQCNVIWNRFPGYYGQSPWLGRLGLEGGALYTQVSHFIDLLIWFCGDVISAEGFVQTKNHDIEIEDCGTARLQFESGTMGSLFWTTCAYNRNLEGSICLVGERGIIKIGGQYLNRIDHWEVEGAPLPENVLFDDKPNSYGQYQGTSSNHDKVFRDVVRRVRRQDFQVVSGTEAKRTVDAIEMIYASCRGRRA